MEEGGKRTKRTCKRKQMNEGKHGIEESERWKRGKRTYKTKRRGMEG